MTMNDLMQDIHANAAAHGWWENPRSDAEIRALIHSEWSEALEEDRAGRPGVWYICMDDEHGMCHPGCPHYAQRQDCLDHVDKPEGWAVELIDGVIRILDYLGWRGYKYAEPLTLTGAARMGVRMAQDMTLPAAVDALHRHVAHSNKRRFEEASVHLNHALCLALAYVAAHGYDPEKVLLDKHEYNKGRPYKHGKQY